MVLACGAVAVDQDQTVSLTDKLVESRLILRGGHAMACLPCGGPCDLAEDGRVAILSTVAIAADHHRLVAFCHELVEGVLVVGRCHAMAGLPRRNTRRLAPDRC